jgi:Dolichyl-phosphate-mannose-protein mannosyltransferase
LSEDSGPGELIVVLIRVLDANCRALASFLDRKAMSRLLSAWDMRGWTARQAAADRYDLATALLFIALIVLVIATFRDYAISNDEEVQQHYGALIVAYYASGFADQALFHFRDLYLYGGLFDVIAVGLQKLLPLDPYDVRHLLCAFTGIGGIGAAWATARMIAGPRAGFLAAAALSVCGIWYGTMFSHTKDIPFAAAMIGALYFLLRLARELPRPRWHWIVLFGILTGCALGIRVLGLFATCYAGIAVVAYAPIGADCDRRGVLAFIARASIWLLPAFGLAYIIMIAAWPWAALAPLNPLRAVGVFDNFHYPISTILDGRVYKMADVPRWYVPAYVAIKLTLLLLIGAGLGVIRAMLPSMSGQISSKTWRKETALVVLAALFPLICDVLAHAPADTGMRHFLFIAPPIAVLAGLGLDGMLRRLEAFNPVAAIAGLAAVVLCLASDTATLYRLHPDEYLSYNALVGGLEGASRRYATDYWVNIMPEAVGDLEQYLNRSDRTGKWSVKRYSVAVCGERLPFEKTADARLQWTPDWRHADFFIAPTHMNCDRALDGRIVAKVERLGVLIGVVKDRRALLAPKLAHNG